MDATETKFWRSLGSKIGRLILDLEPGLLSTIIATGIVGAILSIFAIVSADTWTTGFKYIILGLFGAIAGWLFGIIASPSDPHQHQLFSKYVGIVVSFVGGYLACKVDKLLEDIMKLEYLKTVDTMVPLYFPSGFVMALISVFSFRYHSTHPANQD